MIAFAFGFFLGAWFGVIAMACIAMAGFNDDKSNVG